MTARHAAGRRPAGRLRRVVRATGTGLLLAAAAVVVAAGVDGVRLVPVLTGSMAPYAPAGSLVLTVPSTTARIAPGDVVAFRPPAPYEVVDDRPVLHRVIERGAEGDQPFVVTRGDANARPDPWRLAMDDARIGRAVLVVPFVGKVLAGGAPAALAVVAGSAAVLGGAGSLRPSGRRCDAGSEGMPAAAHSCRHALTPVPAGRGTQAVPSGA